MLNHCYPLAMKGQSEDGCVWLSVRVLVWALSLWRAVCTTAGPTGNWRSYRKPDSPDPKRTDTSSSQRPPNLATVPPRVWAELEEDVLTYITSQDILKLGNWIPYRTRSRTRGQAEIRVLEEKGTQCLSPAQLTCHWAHTNEAVHYATLTRVTRGVTTHTRKEVT